MSRCCTFLPWSHEKKELLCHYSDLAGNYHSQVGWLCLSVDLVPGRSKICIVTAVNWKGTLSVCLSVGLSVSASVSVCLSLPVCVSVCQSV